VLAAHLRRPRWDTPRSQPEIVALEDSRVIRVTDSN